MAKPYINPIGFIDRTTDNRTIFLLNNPEDSRGLKLDAPVTVWRVVYQFEFDGMG